MIVRHHKASLSGSAHGGFSLIELMVAMALSLILLAGVLAIFASSRKTYETTDRLSRIQETGRFALDVIMRDLRSAGYLGCSRRSDLWNALGAIDGVAAQDSVLWNFALPVQGFDAQDDDWVPALEPEDSAIGAVAADGAGDVLAIRGPRGEFEPQRVIAEMNDTTDPVTVNAATLLDADDIVLISDCEPNSGRAIFRITANNAGVLAHSDVDDNPADALPANASGDLNGAFKLTAELVPMQSVVYFLRPSENPEVGTSLWRRVAGVGEAEELVEGVEALQVRYGVDDPDAPVEIEYRTADEVDADGDWPNVATVRIALLVRSLSEYGTDVGPDSYDLLGTEIPNPGDRHMRQVFQTTVTLRNREI